MLFQKEAQSLGDSKNILLARKGEKKLSFVVLQLEQVSESLKGAWKHKPVAGLVFQRWVMLKTQTPILHV